MIVYEVNLRVNQRIASDFIAWLNDHIRAMLELPGFTGAEAFEVEDEAADVRLCVHYRLTDEAALKAYYKNHAQRMRGDAIKRFGDKFTATRRVLHPLH